ncbi:hypothetical protein [Bacteroides clarus]|uniref:hypothetical protein n=1 Tax=Bacteroides clarus TaxID=626929 RepID=UPI0024B22CEC|nr:hypothetical protein [Bacteroides clarus]
MNTKKVFTGLVMLLLTALFHTSCSKEEMTGNSEENNTVRISASLPEDFAETRTAGEIPVKDEHYLRCILEVWDESYTNLLQRHEKLVSNSSDLNFEFKVIEQGTYQCLLWADFITNNTPAEGNATSLPESITTSENLFTDKYYNTKYGGSKYSGLKGIAVMTTNTTDLIDNDACDAFCGNMEITKGAAAVTTEPVVLKRPFAKLILKEKTVENFKNFTGEIKVESKHAMGINVSNFTTWNDKASITYTKTITAAASDATTENVILFSTYIPCTAADVALGDIKLTITPTDGTAKALTIPAGMPIKNNTKTIATGSLLDAGTVVSDGVTLDFNFSTDWNADETKDDINVEPTIKVGDYYLNDGTTCSEVTEENKANIIGVVFAVAENGEISSTAKYNIKDNISNYTLTDGKNFKDNKLHGWVVALTDVANAGNVFASGKNFGSEANTPANFSIHKGKNIRGYNSTTEYLRNDNVETKFKEAVTQYRTSNTTPNTATEWYIPDYAQLQALLSVYSERIEEAPTSPPTEQDFKDGKTEKPNIPLVVEKAIKNLNSESYLLGTSNYLCSSIAFNNGWIPVRFSTSQAYVVNRAGKEGAYTYSWKNSWGANSDGAANPQGVGSVRLILTF